MNSGEDELMSSQQKVSSQLCEIEERVQQAISAGKVQIKTTADDRHIKIAGDNVEHNPESIKQKISKIQEQINSKNAELRHQIQQFELYQSSINSRYVDLHQNGRSRSSNSLRPRSDAQSEGVHSQQQKSQLLQHIQELKRIKKQLRDKNEVNKQRREQKMQSQLQRAQEQQEQQQRQQRQRKREMIQMRLQKLQEIKRSRQKILSIRSTPSLPKYKVIQKKFLIRQLKGEVERKMKEKMSREEVRKQYEADAIKRHQRDYIRKLQEHFGAIRQKTDHSESKMQKPARFDLYQRSESKDSIKRVKELLQKRCSFDNKRKAMVVPLSLQKQRQLQIRKDRIKNSFKYNFLQQKKLNDSEIFEEFKDFELDIDRKRIGDSYLHHVKQQVSGSLQANKRQSKVQDNKKSTEQRRGYKNYIHDGPIKKITPNDLGNILSSGNKSKILEILSKKSLEHDQNVLKKIKHLGLLRPYAETNSLEAEIDEQFLKSIKTKLASIEVLQ